MPTIASSKLPKPSGWDEFENICLSSFQLRWKNQNLSRHGRQGQKQQGVDIYGHDNLQKKVGIQCKNTDTINKSTINEEILKAESFKPPLDALYIATTADTDSALQEYVRVLSENQATNKKFTVEIVFWDAIQQDLSKDQKEVEKHYPQFFSGTTLANQSATEQDRDIKRNNDIKKMKELLSLINIDSTKKHLKYAPKYIHIDFIEQINCFSSKIESPSFHIYDKCLESYLKNWLDKWKELGTLIRNATPPYEEARDEKKLRFRMQGDLCTKKETEKFEKISDVVDEFFSVQKDFCTYIRLNYIEIEL